MSVLNEIIWFTGVSTWGLLGIFGLMHTLDGSIEWVIDSYGLKREFLQFVWERRKRQRAPAPHEGESE